MTEKVVRDAVDRAVRSGLFHERAQIRLRGLAGCNGKARRRLPVGPVLQRESETKLGLQQTQHAYAVFQLGIVLVVFVLRQRKTGAQIHFVAAVENVTAVFFKALRRERLHLRDRRARLLRRIGGEGGELFAVAGETYRHDGNAAHMRVKPRKVLQRALQRRAVVPARHGDDLTLHEDTGFGKPAENVHDLPAARVADELCAQLRIGRVHGDIQRTYLQIADALQLALGKIGAGDIVPREERKARVVVLEIERFAHPARQLIDKAEHAPVGAARRLIHQVRFKVQTEILAFLFSDADRARVPEFQRQRTVIRPVFIIEHVADLVPVDITQFVSGEHPALEPGAGVHGRDRVEHTNSS